MQIKHHMYLNSVGIPESEPKLNALVVAIAAIVHCEFSEKKSYIKK